MLLHPRGRILRPHAGCAPSGVVEVVADGRTDGEIREGRYFCKATEKLVAVLLTTDAGGEGHLRILRSSARDRKFLSLRERGHRCRQSAVVIQRLCNNLIDGRRMEQSPPISLDLAAEGNVLHGVALGGVLLRVQSIARVSRCRRRCGPCEVGAHGTTAWAQGARQ